MKKTTIKLIFPLFMCGMFSTVYAQDVDKKVLNWYNGKKGMATEKAYRKVKKLKSNEVVIAVIDSGIDIEHEDLKGQIWTNKGEIAGNGIDDDKNGYIDDIHGWNFLGNSKGENLNDCRLELTRIYASLKPKYDGVDAKDVASSDKEEYALYLEVKGIYDEKLESNAQTVKQIQQFRDQILPMVPTVVENAIGKKDYTVKDLKKWKPKDAQAKQMKGIAMALATGQFSAEVLDSQIEHYESAAKAHYNVDFNERALIGDDPMDMNDKSYGNGDVEGPDALHGTHVGGIIGSVRGNGLGGDGVATNVKIMSLRAVPNGDEFDKDIALAIRYAVDNGAVAINGSFGKGYSVLPKDVYESIKYAESKGVLFVHAAGNDNANIDKESNFPTSMYDFQTTPFKNYLTIGASTRYTKKMLAAPFSNYGQTKVDVFAPGLEIYNTVQGEAAYKELQGTSMAAPMVTGAIAFMKSYFPELDMFQIKDILLKTAKSYKGKQTIKPGESEEKIDFGKLSVTGAVINLPAAVKMAKKMTKK